MNESQADGGRAKPEATPLSNQLQLRIDLDAAQPDRLLLVAQAEEGVEAHEEDVPGADGTFIDARFGTLAWRQLEEAFQSIHHILKQLRGAEAPAVRVRVGALRRGGSLYPAARYYAHCKADEDEGSLLADGLQPVLAFMAAETLWQDALPSGGSAKDVDHASLAIARGARDLLGAALPCGVQLLADCGGPLLLRRKLAPERVPPETVAYESMTVRPDGYHWSRRTWHVLDRNVRPVDIEFDEAKHLEAIQAVSSSERPWILAAVKVVTVEGKVVRRSLEGVDVIGPGLPLG